jgi:hypothetical protein
MQMKLLAKNRGKAGMAPAHKHRLLPDIPIIYRMKWQCRKESRRISAQFVILQ